MSIKTRPEETGLDELDPGKNPARDAVHFRRIQAARANLRAAEDDLREAVQAARDAGDFLDHHRRRPGHHSTGSPATIRRNLTYSGRGRASV